MNAKRTTHVTPGTGPNGISTDLTPPAGATLAPELVLQQLAFEVEAMSIVRRAGEIRQR